MNGSKTIRQYLPGKIFFSDFSKTPEDHTDYELKRWGKKGNCVLKIENGENETNNPGAAEQGQDANQAAAKNPNLSALLTIFVEQCINAAIVGGIAACATSLDDWQVPVKAFVLTFLIELRKYRKL